MSPVYLAVALCPVCMICFSHISSNRKQAKIVQLFLVIYFIGSTFHHMSHHLLCLFFFFWTKSIELKVKFDLSNKGKSSLVLLK